MIIATGVGFEVFISKKVCNVIGNILSSCPAGMMMDIKKVEDLGND